MRFSLNLERCEAPADCKPYDEIEEKLEGMNIMIATNAQYYKPDKYEEGESIKKQSKVDIFRTSNKHSHVLHKLVL